MGAERQTNIHAYMHTNTHTFCKTILGIQAHALQSGAFSVFFLGSKKKYVRLPWGRSGLGGFEFTFSLIIISASPHSAHALN